ncbi:sialidase-4-like [Bufo bufo]|uniref:sialidase-4-like n=1 Tax=Bufo bufo TaxID=8384 RepID=UPI001ABE9E84|nr:sialidase-4-like [Bufo bufo]
MGSRHVPARTVLFEREKNGVTYRVPALLYIPHWSTLLAFAEERLSADDAHANLLVLRRGILYHSYVEWEDMFAVGSAHLPGHRSMNPCPIYDEFTGQIFLFFIAVQGRTTESYQILTGHNLARLCYVTSSDQGRTWGDVTDLTQKVIGESLKGEWATFALGPGHGIQLKSGRLLLPAYTYHIDCRNCFGKLCRTTPRAFAFRSDDHGKTWTFGDLVPNLQTVECQLVSVDEEDGSNVLYCNARSTLGFRVQALSSDNGIVFQQGQLVEKLVETPSGCHGSVIGFPAPLTYASRLNTKNMLGQPMNAMSRTKLSNTEPKRVPQLLQKDRSCVEHYQLNRYSNIFKVMLHKQTKGKTADINSSYNKGQFSSEVQKSIFRTDYQFQLPTWVLYSHPTSPQRRVNLGVYLSPYPKDSDRWTSPWIIYEGPSAYSDLAYIELQSGELRAPLIVFGCLYENGITSPYEQISFSMFTLYEVIQNLPPNPTLLHPSMKQDGVRGNCSTS